MASARQPHLSNLLLAIIAVLIVVMLMLQVYIVMDIRRPILRPHSVPTHNLPDAWYEKFKDKQAIDSEQVFYFVV
jgi:hypothetical protein